MHLLLWIFICSFLRFGAFCSKPFCNVGEDLSAKNAPSVRQNTGKIIDISLGIHANTPTWDGNKGLGPDARKLIAAKARHDLIN